MISVNLHGALAQEFGKSFELNISKPKEVIRAIDANRPGFRKKIANLQLQGFNYAVIVNKNRKNPISDKRFSDIDIVPLICGAGEVGILAFTIFASVTAAVIQYALLDPGVIEGGEQEVGSQKRSLLFQGGAANIADQGSPLPIGYGRLRVGSQVVQNTIKSYAQSITSVDAMTMDQFKLDSDNLEIEEVITSYS